MSANPVSLDQILARRQAHSGPVVDVDEAMLKLVIVSLGEHWFAFHGDKIVEILADCPVYFLPGCPESLEGVINVRGDIESVIQLRPVLGLPESDTVADSRILLARAAGMQSGLRVDRVEDVLDMPASAIQPPLSTLPVPLRDMALGIVTFRGHAVHLIDLETVFADYRNGLH
ncbi:chemotaxis protein CheW [Paludibacterium yongneupense]|uniref:chemotaxis protein CheW n=1 Tax=Paludibacterium yongneupense TaxID=400061 RepID=UPI000424F936|nr:chemotaxis protein CheW [Paludibacterium yongneupense]